MAIMAGGPFGDEEGPVVFPLRPVSVIDHGDVTRLLESKRKKSNKAILRAADGHKPKGTKKLKKFPGGKNLAKEASKKKKGPFGNVEKPVAAKGKGIRVTESRGPMGQLLEKAPPGREDQVRKLKKNKNIDNPFAVAWASYNKSA